jgi:16S rRNA (cytidine1402-2'-O)-methyltransferase
LYFAENEKTARRMLRRLVPSIELPTLEIHRLDENTTGEECDHFIDLLRQRHGAIISEAGMPCIADPGSRLVARAHRAGLRIVPLTGPSSIVLALAASGLNGQRFHFHGYLPRDAAARKVMIRKLEQDALRSGTTQLFIETPYRNKVLLQDVLATCAPHTLLCVAEQLTGPGERVITRSIGEWRTDPAIADDHPAIFLLGAPGNT